MHRLLHAVFAEDPLAGGNHGPDFRFAESLGDADECDGPRRAAAILGRAGDPELDVGEPRGGRRNGLRLSFVLRHSSLPALTGH